MQERKGKDRKETTYGLKYLYHLFMNNYLIQYMTNVAGYNHAKFLKMESA